MTLPAGASAVYRPHRSWRCETTGATRRAGCGPAPEVPGRAPAAAATVTMVAVALAHPHPGASIMRVSGDIDRATAPGWAHALIAACDHLAPMTSTPRVPRLVCDLNAVCFFGLAGVSALLETAAHAGSTGVELRIVADTGPARRVLDLTGTLDALPVDRRLLHALAWPDTATDARATTRP